MVAIAILGLGVPGYALARALRAPYAWAAAFPLSALLLGEIVIACAITGASVRFVTVLSALAVMTLLALLIAARYGSAEGGDATPATAVPVARTTMWWLALPVAVVVLLVLTGMVVRSSLSPLSGADTAFRWEALARQMLAEQSLAFYPPVSDADFSHYTYPDGFVPLVSSAYWWLYASVEEPRPATTSVLIALQAASCLALVFYTARSLFGVTGGLLALSALASTALFNTGVAIGQETGYTALSCAGQLAFAFATLRQPRLSCAVMAGMFAGLGAISREYGPLLAACGFVVLVSDRATRRYVFPFCAVAIAIGAPWYVRNWIRSGNPLYSIDIAGFPVNEGHAQIMAFYQESLGLRTFSAEKWAQIADQLRAGATLVLFAGLTGIALSREYCRTLGPLALGAIGLWLWSIPYTLGGVTYSLRVLTPAWVVLAIGAGAWGPMVSEWQKRRPVLVRCAVLIPILWCGASAVAAIWAHPRDASEVCTAMFSRQSHEGGLMKQSLITARLLEESGLPVAGVLTDDCYLAVSLLANSQFRPVMVWSPQVAFVFDPKLDQAAVHRRLREAGISYASFLPAHDEFWAKYPYFLIDGDHGFVVPGTAPDQPVLILPAELP
ncbi:MAG TPA: glycosyltransferase family 39 protein [Pirellulales bacterium]|jgi:hypothetical protein